MQTPRGVMSPALASFRTALGDRDLARLIAAWLSIMTGKTAFLVGNLVIAYEAGGAVADGIMGLARYLTPTLLAPLAGLPTARWRPDRVLVSTNAVRTLAVALTALVIAAGLPIEFLYLTIALEAGAGAFTRPLHMGLLPCVARTPEELVAANVTTSATEGLGTFLGPALAGLLLIVSGPLGATIVVLVIYALGLIPLVGLHVGAVGRRDASVRAALAQVVGGIRAATDATGPRLVLIGIGMQTFVRGLLITLTVVAAIELLGMGDPGVGALNAAMGVGGLIGAVVAIALAGRPRLVPAFAIGLAAWGAPIAVIGLVTEPVIALAALVAVGISNAVFDVAAFTLAQRTTPNDRRVAFLGLIDSAANGGVAVGGIVAPLLIAAVGSQAALIVTGLILPVTAVALWPFLHRVDEAGGVDLERAALVRRLPLFAPLSLAAVEHLADDLEPVSFRSGEWLMREGESGDRYIVIERGSAAVTQDGRPIRTVGTGEGVGEIALLRDIPRTASVRAVDAVHGFALHRDAFLEAVTGNATSLVSATSIVEARLAGPSVAPGASPDSVEGAIH